MRTHGGVAHERGASLVEYALLVALIAVVCIAAVTFIGTSSSDKLGGAGVAIENGGRKCPSDGTWSTKRLGLRWTLPASTGPAQCQAARGDRSGRRYHRGDRGR